MTELEKIERYIDGRQGDPGAYQDAVAIFRGHIDSGEMEWHGVNKEFRKRISKAMREEGLGRRELERMNEVFYKSLLLDAPVDFDAYCQYIERNRENRKRFYLPRRKQLLQVVRSLQRLMDDELDLLGISLPPGVGKTTLAIFLLTWVAGRWPEEPNLTGSHSNAFVRGVYDECLRIFDKDGEYLWHDVFPETGVSNTNAKDYRIDLGKRIVFR